MIVNYMESMVDTVLKNEFTLSPEKYTDICRCDSCIAFIKATALNNLTPFYVTSVTGEIYGEYRHKEIQNLSDVMVAVAKGIEALRAAPSHPPVQATAHL